MKKNKKNVSAKILSGVLILLLVFLFLTPFQLAAKSCREAFVECSVDAVIIGLFSGFQSGLLYFSGCAVGYGWCLEYM